MFVISIKYVMDELMMLNIFSENISDTKNWNNSCDKSDLV